MRGESATQGEVTEIIVDGESITSEEGIVRAVEDFWRVISGSGNEEAGDLTDDLNIPVGTFEGIDEEISKDEIRDILKKLKDGKAAGLDTIPYEMYKYGGEWVVENLHRLYKRIWRERRVPKEWNDTVVALLYKGGNKSQKRIESYRPITLSNTNSRVMGGIVNNRLRSEFESQNILSEEQNAFRADRRGEDNVFCVKELVEMCVREGKRAYFGFLDIEKAYDRVDRGILLGLLEKIGIPERIVSIIGSMYTDTRSKYKLGDMHTDYVELGRGVRQGCTLSPLLFNLYTEELMHRVKRVGNGIQIGDEKLSILMYADDIVIMTESREDMQECLNAVETYANDFKVKFGAAKSQVLVVSGPDEPEEDWHIGDTVIKQTKEYKYLGVKFRELGCDVCKDEKVAKVNQWWGRMHSAAKFRANKYDVVRCLWKGMGVPAVVHAANVLNWTQQDFDKLEVAQNKIGRVALGQTG